MGFFRFGEKPAEVGQGAGRSEGAVYRGEVSPISSADPSQPIEFSLSEEEMRAAQEGRLETKGMGEASIPPEDVTTAREHLFGENVVPQGESTIPSLGDMKVSEAAHGTESNLVAPGSQGNGENHISYSSSEVKADGEEGSDDEPKMPSVLGGF